MARTKGMKHCTPPPRDARRTFGLRANQGRRRKIGCGVAGGIGGLGGLGTQPRRRRQLAEGRAVTRAKWTGGCEDRGERAVDEET